jgi:hypothetical protein
MKVKSEILNREFEVTYHHLGLRVSDELWQHDAWLITINGESVDYKTGIGHRKAKTKYDKKEFKEALSRNLKQTKENLLIFNERFETISKPVQPTLDDVLNGIIMDASCATEIFDDWCDNFGYDHDSRKAYRLYEECQKQVLVCRALKLTADDCEAFEDY